MLTVSSTSFNLVNISKYSYCFYLVNIALAKIELYSSSDIT